MNWLAHVLLSEPSPRFRIGNILPDVLGMQSLAPLAPEYQRGIACHRAIDAFTDGHPVFHRSRQRFHDGYRRFSGILVDVFYDHLLARQWRQFAIVPLLEFVGGFYTEIPGVQDELPEAIRLMLDHLRREDWLGSNASLDGPRGALHRVERRLRGRADLNGAVALFERERAGLAEDFSAFFPDLVAHVHARGLDLPVPGLPPPASPVGATGSILRSL